MSPAAPLFAPPVFSLLCVRRREKICLCGPHMATPPNSAKIGVEQALNRHFVSQLFLYSVDHEKCTDMIPGFYLLIACLHKAISEAPEAIRRSALAKLPQSGAGGSTTLMGRICENVSAKVDDANQVRFVRGGGHLAGRCFSCVFF